MIIKKTCIKGRYNLVDEEKPSSDEGRYVRQLSTLDVIKLKNSIIEATNLEIVYGPRGMDKRDLYEPVWKYSISSLQRALIEQGKQIKLLEDKVRALESK